MFMVKKRLPKNREILYVLATSVFVVFSWSLRGFFEYLPSFLKNQLLGAIYGIFSYMMAFALLESLLLTGVLLLLSMILPGRWYRDGFAYKSFLVIAVVTATSINLQKFLTNEWPSLNILLPRFGIAFLILLGLILLAHFLLPLQRILLDIEDRMQIFLYIYLPIGVLGFLTVLIRNVV